IEDGLQLHHLAFAGSAMPDFSLHDGLQAPTQFGIAAHFLGIVGAVHPAGTDRTAERFARCAALQRCRSTFWPHRSRALAATWRARAWCEPAAATAGTWRAATTTELLTLHRVAAARTEALRHGAAARTTEAAQAGRRVACRR